MYIALIVHLLRITVDLITKLLSLQIMCNSINEFFSIQVELLRRPAFSENLPVNMKTVVRPHSLKSPLKIRSRYGRVLKIFSWCGEWKKRVYGGQNLRIRKMIGSN